MMRALFAGVVVVSMGSGGCALISGLSDYEGHVGDKPDSSVARVIKDGAGTVTIDDAGTARDDEPAGEDASDAASDAAVASDGPWIIVIPDDAGDAMLLPDVNTTCDTTSCAGCCSNGECVGGQSVATCGVGGGSCIDCTSMGGACTSGACTTKVPDAGTKTCTVSKCGGCIPFYQSSCCKSDETCGCTMFGSSSCK
jgi:hypothetical protein